jgi:tetratricopeptide (TPR) repeat protein
MTGSYDSTQQDALGALNGSADAQAAEQGIGMSGDLANMSLADVFQTLSLSKLEGLLKVHAGSTTREIAFKDGMARVLPVAQGESRRIGRRLVAAGLVSQEQLQTALMAQRKKGRLLGEHLVATGAVDQAKLDTLLHSQAEEDLYGLFTWRKGSFVFYKGNGDEGQQGGFCFDSNHVLLEVARRSDEWEMILDALGDLDEVFVATGSVPRKLAATERRVLEAVDGTSSVRALADLTLVSLFECARALRVLREAGAVEPAAIAGLLAAAEKLRAEKEVRESEEILDLIAQRRTLESREQARDLARQWRAQGSNRGAAAALAAGAAFEEDVAERTALLREAVALDPSHLDATLQLRDLLLQQPQDEALQAEIHLLRGRIADALLDLGRNDEALAAADAMIAARPGDLGSHFKRTKVLQRMGEPGVAADDLMAFADDLKAIGAREALAQLYEQVLKLDPSRREVTRLLYALRVSRGVRLRRKAIFTGVAILIAGVGLLGWSHHSTQSQALACLAAANQAMVAGDLDKAEQLVHKTVAIAGDAVQSAVDAALQDIQARRKAIEEAKVLQRQAETQRRLDHAADAFENGDWSRALSSFWEVQKTETDESERIRSIVETRLRSLCSWIEDRVDKAPNLKVEIKPKADLQGDLKMLKAAFPIGIEVRLADLERTLGSPDATLQNPETLEKLRQLIRQMLDANTRALTRCRQLESLINDEKLKDRLNPTFVSARKAEEEFRFADALADYRVLAEQYRGDTDLHAHFRDMVLRFEFIVKYMAELQAATERRDFGCARKALIVLLRAHPDTPFGRLVEMPLTVSSVPSGARVQIGDRDVGTTPLATRYRPDGRTVVRLLVDRHEPAEEVIESASTGAIHLNLARKPDWVRELPGPVDQDPVLDTRGGVLIADRSGQLHCLDLGSGAIRWIFVSKEPSGLLFAPLVHRDRAYCASLDRTLFALDLATGQQVWRIALPGAVHASPILARGQLLLATAEGLAVLLDSGDGKEVARAATNMTLRLPPLLTTAGVILTGQGGEIRLLATDLGREIWHKTLEGTSRSLPAANTNFVFVAEGDRRLTALRLEDGIPAWRVDLTESVRFPLAVDRDELWFATDQRLVRSVGAADGRERRRCETTDVPSSGPVITAQRVYVGLQNGETLQILRAAADPQPRLLATRPVRGRPVATGPGGLVTVSEDRMVRAFLP